MERTVQAYFEAEVNYNGLSYTVIYGEHLNGGWCCVPNWGIGCEMGSIRDLAFNASALEQVGLKPGAAKAIADQILISGTALEAQGQLPEYGHIGNEFLKRLLGTPQHREPDYEPEL